MRSTRRQLLHALPLAASAPALATNTQWNELAQLFPVDRRIANFNHAGVGTTPTSVADAVVARTWSGEKTAPGTIFSYAPAMDQLRQRLASLAGADAEELAIVRNSTEALNIVLMGVPLRAGDEVLTTTLDYWAMIDALEERQQRDGIVLRKVSVPTVPRSMDEVFDAIVAGFTPKTKLLLISHPINLNGQLFPVRRLSDEAHRRGIEVVVDAAQSFGLFPYSLHELGCDYLGTSLHKWLMAPKGTGLLYMRRAHIEKVWPLFPAGKTKAKSDIRKFELYGTWPESILAINDAITFHLNVGPDRKAARLEALRQRWLSAVRTIPGLEVHTNTDAGMSHTIATISIKGRTAADLRRWLLEEKQILTMDVSRRTSQFSGVRISCGLSTTEAEIERLITALKQAANA
jgi:isopenicillin-N epimerase